MKNIIVGGMPQAGSTLCFNLIREMIEANGMGVQVKLGSRKAKYSKKGEETKLVDYNLVKTHARMGNKFHHTINVRRDIRDSVASNKRKDPKFMGGDVMKIAKRNMGWYNQYLPISDYEFVYEHYKADPLTTMRALNNLFGFELNDKELMVVIDKAEGLKDEKLSHTHEWGHAMWDKTLMSEIHITSNKGKVGGYKDTLTKEEIAKLEKNYGDWLKNKGYE